MMTAMMMMMVKVRIKMIKNFLSILMAILVVLMSTLACNSTSTPFNSTALQEQVLAGPPLQGTPLLGDIWLVAQNTTAYWVNQAFNGAAFTQILSNGNGGYFILWYPNNIGVGFTLINEAGTANTAVLDWVKATGGKGNLINFKDTESVVQYMKDNGWKTVAAGEVPATLRLAWSTFAQAVATGIVDYGSAMISILLVPVGILPPALLDPSVNDAVIWG
jgi:hypothetical protein